MTIQKGSLVRGVDNTHTVPVYAKNVYLVLGVEQITLRLLGKNLNGKREVFREHKYWFEEVK